MSRENVELVQNAYAAFNGGDLETLRALFSEEIEWHVTDMFFDQPRTYRGWQAWQGEFLRDLMEVFAQFSATPEEVLDAGDQVLVMARAGGLGRLSGVKVAARVGHVFTFSKGSISRFTEFKDSDEALKAAGLEG